LADDFAWTMKKKKSPDPIDPQRSALMARVRQRHSAPELEVRGILRALNVPYKLHRKSLPGTPDICIPSVKGVIFVHGCFWHRHAGCKKATTPKTRRAFWLDKFTRNVARDADNLSAIRKLGWRSLVLWECQCKDTAKLTARLSRFLSTQAGIEEIGTHRSSVRVTGHD
jgi:DNA mismatch endonuclease (patch repair protein)